MEIVVALARRSLINKAKSWWVGANVEGKPQGMTQFTGGFPKYREYCAAAAHAGYRDFVFKHAEALMTA